MSVKDSYQLILIKPLERLWFNHHIYIISYHHIIKQLDDVEESSLFTLNRTHNPSLTSLSAAQTI